MIEYRVIRNDEIDDAILLIKEGLKERLGSLSIVDFSDINKFDEIYQSNDASFFVAIKDGEIIGTCGVRPLRENIYTLSRLSVNSQYRGKGIGKALLDKAHLYAFKKGIEYTQLEVNKTWTDAIAMYRNFDYEITEETETVYYMIRKNLKILTS